ncbi:MAG: hypothetical protein H6621_04150 [Halobacteriovoraceae bacterium]|nr:hypothetical protein [Halobacteriovoraceae bacterium]MCB9094242.1 hypothetical protein [Halobacteriovoraceae bacterium]
MNRILFYISFVAIYLAMSKSFGPDNTGIEYIRRAKDLSSLIYKAPATAILTQNFTKGYLIKTYYQKYKIIYGFQPSREVVVRTKRSFAEYTKKYVGMSLFRIDSNGSINTTPMPPGSLYIGNRQFGKWTFEHGEYSWKFYGAYKNFPKHFGWGEFKPTKTFYKAITENLEKGLPFTGLNHEFGQGGEITEKYIPSDTRRFGIDQIKLNTLISEYFKTNYTF